MPALRPIVPEDEEGEEGYEQLHPPPTSRSMHGRAGTPGTPANRARPREWGLPVPGCRDRVRDGDRRRHRRGPRTGVLAEDGEGSLDLGVGPAEDRIARALVVAPPDGVVHEVLHDDRVRIPGEHGALAATGALASCCSRSLRRSGPPPPGPRPRRPAADGRARSLRRPPRSPNVWESPRQAIRSTPGVRSSGIRGPRKPSSLTFIVTTRGSGSSSWSR